MSIHQFSRILQSAAAEPGLADAMRRLTTPRASAALAGAQGPILLASWEPWVPVDGPQGPCDDDDD